MRQPHQPPLLASAAVMQLNHGLHGLQPSQRFLLASCNCAQTKLAYWNSPHQDVQGVPLSIAAFQRLTDYMAFRLVAVLQHFNSLLTPANSVQVHSTIICISPSAEPIATPHNLRLLYKNCACTYTHIHNMKGSGPHDGNMGCTSALSAYGLNLEAETLQSPA